MAELTRETWERKFRADAEADNLAIFRDHLRSLDLEGKTTAESMLEGTVRIVDICCAYALIDGRSAAPFLAAQTYDPARSGAMTYALTFDIWGDACARLLLGADLDIPGIAHLLDDSSYDYEVTSYTGVLISHHEPDLDSHYTIDIDGEVSDGGANESTWLDGFLDADLFFDLPEEEAMDGCCTSERVIGTFYISVRRRSR